LYLPANGVTDSRTKSPLSAELMISKSETYVMAFVLLGERTSKKGDDLDHPGRGRNLSTFAKKVLAYWVDHPTAKDTLDGITDWWIRYQEFECWRPQVERALSELVTLNLVLEKKRPGLETYYELNRKSVQEIRQMIGKDREK